MKRNTHTQQPGPFHRPSGVLPTEPRICKCYLYFCAKLCQGYTLSSNRGRDGRPMMRWCAGGGQCGWPPQFGKMELVLPRPESAINLLTPIRQGTRRPPLYLTYYHLHRGRHGSRVSRPSVLHISEFSERAHLSHHISSYEK